MRIDYNQDDENDLINHARVSNHKQMMMDVNNEPDSGNILHDSGNIQCDSGNIWRDSGDDDNKPVWLNWAVDALFRGARRIHINRVCPIV
jgi:hypothetical protein